jgi:ribonuclease P protein component
MGTIWRLSDPAAFARLRSTRQRARTGALWLAFVAPLDPTIPPRVAFAIGRKVGGAVVRNRIRRRLRAALATTELPAGDYLIGAAPAAAEATWDELNQQVRAMIESIAGPRASAVTAGSA